MNKFYYDFHIHSCLSPCGDSDNTPNNIAGMASLCELDIVALTDHNSAKNCPAFFAAAEKYGIIPIAGMELTTSEDIHVVCLFENLSDALSFDEYVQQNRPGIRNKPEFFGEQLILNENDNVIGSEENLLTNATFISIDEVFSKIQEFGGFAYPAHIDRDSYSITAVLGTIPPDSEFTFFELHDSTKTDEFSLRYGLNKNRILISSDAHYLTSLKDRENFLLLDCEKDKPDLVRKKLFEMLRNPTL